MQVDLEFVENPPRRKRRRRRRTLTAAQRRAGFGGKAAMGGSRPRRTTRRRRTASSSRRRYRRRNPSLMAVGNPRRRRRSYRNPSMFGFQGLDIGAATAVGVGLIGVNMVPNLVKRYLWSGLPTTGVMGYLVKGGTVLALGWGTQMVTNATRRNQVMAGALAGILVQMFNEYAAPALGLSGTRGYVPSPRNISKIGQVRDYVKTPAQIPMSRGQEAWTEMAA